jgi:hypothetical protein
MNSTTRVRYRLVKPRHSYRSAAYRSAIRIPLTLALTACDSRPDQRVFDAAREQSARQAEQHKQILTIHQELAEGSRRLVESDARTRERISLAISLNSGLTAIAIPARCRSVFTDIRQEATSASCAPPIEVNTAIRVSHFR